MINMVVSSNVSRWTITVDDKMWQSRSRFELWYHNSTGERNNRYNKQQRPGWISFNWARHLPCVQLHCYHTLSIILQRMVVAAAAIINLKQRHHTVSSTFSTIVQQKNSPAMVDKTPWGMHRHNVIQSKTLNDIRFSLRQQPFKLLQGLAQMMFVYVFIKVKLGSVTQS